ncbi:MAG: hypothetical protein H0U91_09875 [Rubrobacter sp.]|nr:hypothetical protein [Rubrobacter sp.]
MGLRRRVKRLEKETEGGTVFIPQRDGTVKRFPQSALQDSFLANMGRLRGRDVPPHPLGLVAAASPDPEWSRSMYSADFATTVTPPEDLSE